jgi:hypothetical protein
MSTTETPCPVRAAFEKWFSTEYPYGLVPDDKTFAWQIWCAALESAETVTINEKSYPRIVNVPAVLHTGDRLAVIRAPIKDSQ